MAELAGLHHAALSVSDLDASARWYQDVLGLEETFRHDSATSRMVVLSFPSGGAGLRGLNAVTSLGLVEHSYRAEPFRAQNLGLDHLAFRVTSWEELDAWAHQMEEHAVLYTGPVETPFGGMLHFTDPDGIALALFWERP